MATNALALAAKQLGLNENAQAAAIQDYLQTGGANLDPQTTAWCAAFVNATLQQSGMKGTGSNMARSFLEWGQGVETPQPGDIGVLPRGDRNGPYGHVGFVQEVRPDGTIMLLAGNQGDAVSVRGYRPDAFLGFRRGPNALPQGQQVPQVPQVPRPQLALRSLAQDPAAFQQNALMQGMVVPERVNYLTGGYSRGA